MTQMKRLTKYKDGKFLLNHSSMNEAIDKLGKYELADEINKNKEYFYKYKNGEIEKSTILDKDYAYVDFTGEGIIITYNGIDNRWVKFENFQKTWSLNREDLEDE